MVASKVVKLVVFNHSDERTVTHSIHLSEMDGNWNLWQTDMSQSFSVRAGDDLTLLLQVDEMRADLGRCSPPRTMMLETKLALTGQSIEAKLQQDSTNVLGTWEMSLSDLFNPKPAEKPAPAEKKQDPALAPVIEALDGAAEAPYPALRELLVQAGAASPETFERAQALGSAFHAMRRIDRLQYALCELCASAAAAHQDAPKWHQMRRDALLAELRALTPDEVREVARLADLEQKTRGQANRIHDLAEAVKVEVQEAFARPDLDAALVAELASFHREFCLISRFSDIMGQSEIDPNTASDIPAYLFQGGGSDFSSSGRGAPFYWLTRTLHELGARIRDELRAHFRKLGYEPIVPRAGLDFFDPGRHEDLDPRDVKECPGKEGLIYQCIRFGVRNGDEVVSKALVLRYQSNDDGPPEKKTDDFEFSETEGDFVEGGSH